jgi:hypothetical protein
MFGDQGTGQEGIVLSLLSPQSVESNILRGFRNRRDIFQSKDGKCSIKFHFFTTKDTKYTKENPWKGAPLIIRPTLVTVVSFVFNQASTP